mmetsp:Transcript_17729/g.66942  ORF Transcript_17729/g.66942 Transcript_17729/m.66942 type:complete len:203 (+) Transcript_17729:719-1327(+)
MSIRSRSGAVRQRCEVCRPARPRRHGRRVCWGRGAAISDPRVLGSQERRPMVRHAQVLVQRVQERHECLVGVVLVHAEELGAAIGKPLLDHRGHNGLVQSCRQGPQQGGHCSCHGAAARRTGRRLSWRQCQVAGNGLHVGDCLQHRVQVAAVPEVDQPRARRGFACVSRGGLCPGQSGRAAGCQGAHPGGAQGRDQPLVVSV